MARRNSWFISEWVKDGKSAQWYENDPKISQGFWKNNRDGKWTYWKNGGNLKEKVSFKEGKRFNYTYILVVWP